MMNMFGGMFSGWLLLLLLVAGGLLGVGLFRRLASRNHGGTRQGPEGVVRSLDSRILKLAADRGGTLTVSDVVMATGMTMREAEKVLDRMVDSYRVDMHVDESGIMTYEFLEVSKRTRNDEEPDR